MAIHSVAILGAGNGGCAAAADLSRRGYDVRLFSRSERTLAPLRARGGIALREGGEESFSPLAQISTDIAAVVAGADLIVVSAPALAHAYLAEQLAPRLGPGRTILLNPGHTGGSLHFAHTLRRAGFAGEIRLCETVTLTYICRMPEPACVEIYRRTTNLRCAAFPAAGGASLVAELREIFPNIVPAENVLETGFSNINALMHPAGTLANAGWIEQSRGDFLYYREGITPSVARWIEAIDRERLRIVGALGLEPVPFVEIFYQAGLTTPEARAAGSVYRAIHESAPNRSIKAPPSLNHRYIHEDVGYGLVPMAEIGNVVGLKCPVIDATITLAAAVTGIDYRREGLTLNRMGLAGAGPRELDRTVREGFR
ncbi:MAG TPA: NAD/NADP octopine/nopaline dehydrogenase family protein [candidate division Zixibacteria bacterium]|nr:NAD/NADP octopine/nopaline dehydrogenase family protein [candidate division Zixibacteria bacterium]